MITQLRIRNFRSVLSTRVRFSPSGLTVLVGSNGSGKSNLVRALDFIRTLHEEGLSAAVIGQGGQKSLFPKSLPHRSLRGVATEIDYRLELNPPHDYPTGHPRPGGRHLLRFRVGTRNEVRIDKEILDFNQALAVARAIESPRGTTPDVSDLPSDTRVRVSRTPGRGILVSTRPSVQARYLEEFVAWFGLQFLLQGDSKISVQEFQDLLGGIKEQIEKDDRRTDDRTLLDIAIGFLAFSNHVGVFRSAASNVKRFQLYASSLRTDQQPSNAAELSSRGDNLPALVRRLSQGHDGVERWERVLSTLRDVAPFVFDVSNDLLKSGREYIQFMETQTGRPVESWDASDGTLRALAILVAVETHPGNQTLVIEEPEMGLHPWAVRFMLEHVREAIARRGVQVILTTHSPQVVEAADPEEVLIVTRTHERGTEVSSVADWVGDASLSSRDLGRLWVKGLIGGHPHDR